MSKGAQLLITIESKAFKEIMDRFAKLEQMVKTMINKNNSSTWMDEAEAMLLTGLSKDTLRRKRKAREFNYSMATGRKIKYLRRDIENYLDDNSTVI